MLGVASAIIKSESQIYLSKTKFKYSLFILTQLDLIYYKNDLFHKIAQLLMINIKI